MSNSLLPKHLSHPSHAVALAVTGIVAALGLVGCSLAPNSKPAGVQPEPATSTAVASATPGQKTPTVVGHLDIDYHLVTGEATLPQQPIRYTLVVRMAGQTAEAEYPVDANGDFGIALAPGTYDIPYVIIEAADSAHPLKLPMTNTDTLRVSAPATGCTYAGQVLLRYGRLPAGSLQRQTAMMQQLVQAAGHNLTFGYLPSGGIVVIGGETSIAPVGSRPAAAKDCAVEEFTSMPT